MWFSCIIIRWRPKKNRKHIVHILTIQMQKFGPSCQMRTLKRLYFEKIYGINWVNLPSPMDNLALFVIVRRAISTSQNIFSYLVRLWSLLLDGFKRFFLLLRFALVNLWRWKLFRCLVSQKIVVKVGRLLVESNQFSSLWDAS